VRCAEVLAGAQPAVQVDGPWLEDAAAKVLHQARAQQPSAA
jgi:hypothetical protein